MELRCRGVQPDPMDMSFGELWAHKRVFLSLDASDAAREVNAAALGSRGKPEAIRKHLDQLGVSDGAS